MTAPLLIAFVAALVVMLCLGGIKGVTEAGVERWRRRRTRDSVS